MATEIDRNISQLFRQIEVSIKEQQAGPQQIGLVCNAIRPHESIRDKTHTPITDAGGDSKIKHVNLKDTFTRGTHVQPSNELVPTWVFEEMRSKRDVEPMYIKYIQSCETSENFSLLHTRLSRTSRHFIGKPRESYKPNSTHQFLTDTDVRDCTADEMDLKHGRPTRATLLRARLTSDRIPINTYTVHRERVQKLADLKANQIIVLDLNQLLEMHTNQQRHTFLTGARYNRSRYVDSKSIETWGMYMLRDNPSIGGTFVCPSLSRIIKKLEDDDTPPAPPESPLEMPRTVRINSAPAAYSHSGLITNSDEGTTINNNNALLNIKGTSVSKGTSTSTLLKPDTSSRSVLPSVSGVSFTKLKMQKDPSDVVLPSTPDTARSAGHNVSLVDCVTKRSLHGKDTSTISLVDGDNAKDDQVVVIRRRKRRKKPVMVDRSMNFPPTASEADSTDLLIFGKTADSKVDKLPPVVSSTSLVPNDNLNNNNINNIGITDGLLEVVNIDKFEQQHDENVGGNQTRKDFHRESTGMDSVAVQLSDSEKVVLSETTLLVQSSNGSVKLRDATKVGSEREDKNDKIEDKRKESTSDSRSRSRSEMKTPLEGRELSNLTADEWNGVTRRESQIGYTTENSMFKTEKSQYGTGNIDHMENSMIETKKSQLDVGNVDHTEISRNSNEIKSTEKTHEGLNEITQETIGVNEENIDQDITVDRSASVQALDLADLCENESESSDNSDDDVRTTISVDILPKK